MSILTAQITDVPIGLLTIPGLMDEEGKFYVGVPQVTEQFQFDGNQASRDIKALLGKGFQFAQLKTSLCPKAINALTLVDAEKLTRILAAKGNRYAQIILFGESCVPAKNNRNKSKLKHLYVVVDEPRGVCKIGIAENVIRRMRDIQTCYPFVLSIYFAKLTPNARSKEYALHKALDDYRLEGEWFDLSCLNIIDWTAV